MLIRYLVLLVCCNMYFNINAQFWACLDRQLFIYRCFYQTRKWCSVYNNKAVKIWRQIQTFLDPIASKRMEISNNYFFKIIQINNTNDLMYKWHFWSVCALCTRLSNFLIKQWRIGPGFADARVYSGSGPGQDGDHFIRWIVKMLDCTQNIPPHLTFIIDNDEIGFQVYRFVCFNSRCLEIC